MWVSRPPLAWLKSVMMFSAVKVMSKNSLNCRMESCRFLSPTLRGSSRLFESWPAEFRIHGRSDCPGRCDLHLCGDPAIGQW